MLSKTILSGASFFKNLPWLEIAWVATLVSLIFLYFEPELSRWWFSPTQGRVGIAYLDEDFADSCMAEPYVVSLPTSYYQQTNWPLLVFLHGSGERGNDSKRPYEIAERLAGSYAGEMPAVIIVPQCRRSHYRWQANDIRRLITIANRDYDIDPNRTYLIGFSMGAYGTWGAAAANPDLFAAIVPMAGGGDCESATELAAVPTWAFHGEKDEVVPVTETTGMIDAIRAEGGSARLTLYPKMKHFVFHRAIETPELWDWLFEQSLEYRQIPSSITPNSNKYQK